MSGVPTGIHVQLPPAFRDPSIGAVAACLKLAADNPLIKLSGPGFIPDAGAEKPLPAPTTSTPPQNSTGWQAIPPALGSFGAAPAADPYGNASKGVGRSTDQSAAEAYRPQAKPIRGGDAIALRSEAPLNHTPSEAAKWWGMAPDNNQRFPNYNPETDPDILAGTKPAPSVETTPAVKSAPRQPVALGADGSPLPVYGPSSIPGSNSVGGVGPNVDLSRVIPDALESVAKRVAESPHTEDLGKLPNFTDGPDTSAARSAWNTVNKATGGIPSTLTNTGSAMAGAVIPEAAKRFATKPLTSYVGLGDPKLRVGDAADWATGGGFSRTVSPQIKDVFNVGTSPIELLPAAAAVKPVARAFRAGAATEGAAAAVRAPVIAAGEASGAAETLRGAGGATLPGGTRIPAPPVPVYPKPPGTPSTALPPIPPPKPPPLPVEPPIVPPAAPAAATKAPSWGSTIRNAVLPMNPGLGRSAVETATGIAPFTNAYRVGANLAGYNPGGFPSSLYRGAVGTTVPMVASSVVPPLVHKEGPGTEAYRARMQDPTQQFMDLHQGLGAVTGGEGSVWSALAQKVTLPLALPFGTAANAFDGGNRPSMSGYFGGYVRNLGDAAEHVGSNIQPALQNANRGVTDAYRKYQAGGGNPSNPYVALNGANDEYQNLHNELFAQLGGVSNPEALAAFRQKSKALGERIGQMDVPINPEAARQHVIDQQVFTRLQREFADNPAALQKLQQLRDTPAAARETPRFAEKNTNFTAKLPFFSQRDLADAHREFGMTGPGGDTLNIPANLQNNKPFEAADKILGGNTTPDYSQRARDQIEASFSAKEKDLREQVQHHLAQVQAQGTQVTPENQPPVSAAPPGPETPPVTPPSLPPMGPPPPSGLTTKAPPVTGPTFPAGAAPTTWPAPTTPALPVPPAGATPRQGPIASTPPMGVPTFPGGGAPAVAPVAPSPGALPGAPPTTPVMGAPPQGNPNENKPMPEVKQNIQGIIEGHGGVQEALHAATQAQAPPGFRSYWSGLDSSSRFLAIAGLSLTAISMLKSMFSDEKDDAGFLSKALPFLGIGAAGWALGGGSIGFGKENLPSMDKYKELGNAVSTNFGDLRNQFAPAAK